METGCGWLSRASLMAPDAATTGDTDAMLKSGESCSIILGLGLGLGLVLGLWPVVELALELALALALALGLGLGRRLGLGLLPSSSSWSICSRFARPSIPRVCR